MRIRYLSQYYPPEPGAPASRVSHLSEAWAALGHEVEVVTGFPNHPQGVVPPEWRGKVTGLEETKGVRVQRNWLLALPNRAIAQRLVAQASYGLTAATLGAARARPCDVVIATHPSIFTGWAGLVHARLHRVPFVLEVRDLWPQLFIEMGMIKNPILVKALNAMELALYRSADLIIALTNRFRDRIIEKGIAPERVKVIHNGVDLTDFQVQPGEAGAVRRALNLDDKFVVSYVGTHGVLHRLDLLIDVADHLRGQPRLHFLFVGDGAERPKLEKLAKDRGLVNVTFAGLQPYSAIRGFYAASDLLYVPLRPDRFLLENFVPSKIFEILATGRPILGALGGEAAGIVRESGLGRVVTAGNIVEICEAIIDCAANPPSQAARDLARLFVTDFSWERLSQEYLGHLSNLVRNSGLT